MTARLIQFFKDKNKLVFLFLFWTLTQVVIYAHGGIKTPVDAPTYLQNAHDLINGLGIREPHDFWYASYLAFLAACLTIFDSVFFVVFVQLIFSALALLALFQLTLKISHHERAAFLAAFLYIFWFEIHTWNFFIYTESLFTSCTIISFYFLVCSKTGWHYAASLVFVFFTALIRPVGFSFVAAVTFFLLLKLKLPTKIKWAMTVIALPLLLLLLNKMLAGFDLIESYSHAEIIYPDINFILARNPSLQLPDENNAALWNLFYFIIHNPFYFVKLCILKLFLFFAHTKPYFSTVHTIYIVAILYPLYFFAARTIRRSTLDKSVLRFILCYVGMQGVTVMLTSENWDGRFLVPALPFIFILAAIGIDGFLQKKNIVNFY